MFKHGLVLALACVFSTAAMAQDDDELAPLAPIKKKDAPKKPAAKPPTKPAKPPPTAKKPKPVEDDLTPIAPVISKGDIVVKVAGGLTGAVLSIDGKEIGVLPLSPQSVSTGEHTVAVKRMGYAQFVKKVTVAPAKAVEIEAKLTAVAAVLSVTSDVSDAQVLINGRSIGTAPITDYEVPAGPVELSVIKEGFKEDRQKLTLVAGREYPIVVKFNPGASKTLAATDKPIETTLVPNVSDQPPITVTQGPKDTPIYGRWYFWAGVAAVVTGAVVGGVAIGNAAQGKIPRTEDQICNGNCAGCIGLSCAAAGALPLPY